MILSFQLFQEIADSKNGDPLVFLQFQKMPVATHDLVGAGVQSASQNSLVVSRDDQCVVFQEGNQLVDISIGDVVFTSDVGVIQCGVDLGDDSG